LVVAAVVAALHTLSLSFLLFLQRKKYTNDNVLQRRVRTALCDRSFAVAGPRIWNSLPASIRDPTLSAGTFATLLKTYLFV